LAASCPTNIRVHAPHSFIQTCVLINTRERQRVGSDARHRFREFLVKASMHIVVARCMMPH
jgi:hypothetical protein